MTTKLEQVYECHNSACPLGSRKDAGRFTNGITAEQKNLLTGDPIENMVEGEDYGEGVCSTCGEKGTPVPPDDNGGHLHDFGKKGSDPHQDLHDEVQARVEDEEDPLTARGAQRELLALVKQREGTAEEEVDEDA